MRLLHYSEDPGIEVFEPHVAATAEGDEPLVWAVDEHRAHTYWFPRECPRVTFWPPIVHAIEWGWFEAMRTTVLYEYELEPAGFERHGTAPAGSGDFWVSRATVSPLAVRPVGDLVARHAAAGIELRLVANLWPLRDRVVEPGAVGDFSIIRMHNARPRSAEAGAGDASV